MLLRFGFSNHRTFSGTAELSFIAARGSDLPDHPRPWSGARHGVLPVVGLYGANASGKSSVLHAFSMMAAHVTQSFIGVKPNDKVPRQPFKLHADQLAAPSRFDCDLVLDNVHYHYGFSCTAAGFDEEWLYAWPAGVRQVWFHRRAGEPMYVGSKLRRPGMVPDIEARPNSLWLSAAAQVGHPQLSVVYGFFARQVARREIDAHTQVYYPESPLFDPARRDQVLALLRAADLGVVDLRVVSRRDRVANFAQMIREGGADRVADEVERRLSQHGDLQQLLLAHQTNAAPVWLEPEEESDGTLTLLNHLHDVLSVIDQGGLLLVDELDRCLHPQLSARVLELFTNPASNPHNAQLLFTSHDTSLFAGLRRDEIVLVEKGDDGSATLAPLSDFKPLKREDLETYYRQGRYGGVPRLGDFARALRVPRRKPGEA